MNPLRFAWVAVPLLVLAGPPAVRAQTLMAPPAGGVRIQPVTPRVGEQQTVDPSAGTLDPAVACPGKLQAMREQNSALRNQVLSLQEQLNAYTSREGSRVTAYCESPTLSRNTAGASSDFARAGYGCEPVSGLCRTSAQSSVHCAPGFVFNPSASSCVPASTSGDSL